MDKLQVRPAEFSTVKAKAVDDAKQMQKAIEDEAVKAGTPLPKYALLELIGKGSFGRVYKGKDMTDAKVVAVKIIDIDESDTINPRNADSYSEFLKEVNALKILGESNAKNINLVLDAVPVGKAMWMITEYCGGGSIATLMKPTAPGGLQEKWIIPILREVAEAIHWVHEAGIIHRDIKCANVLITEEGGVQLCDFGVAGIVETKLDKRSTVIGTPHWMAPELFSSTPSYGKEVDIWAFGSMIFEIATGLPPNVANGIPYERLGNYLKTHVPRLEGGNYSNDLRSIVACCLEELPSARPPIEQVQNHPYIKNSASKYPTSTLRLLVRAFKQWESHGGSRKSLFMIGGAQGPSQDLLSPPDDEWNFSTTVTFDQEVSRRQSIAQDLFDAYGTNVEIDAFLGGETARPSKQAQKPSRRRPPPEALARFPAAPLEKIFDPNTITNYEENSKQHYGRQMPPPASTSDLPLRAESSQTSIRESMIDLGGHDSDTGLSNFPDMDTIKAGRRVRDESEDEYSSTLHDFSRPAHSDPADTNPNRRTQDWKFPSLAAPPASADPEVFVFPGARSEVRRPSVTPGSGSRPTLVHHETEPIGAFAGGLMAPTSGTERLSVRESLIDLDMGMFDMGPEIGYQPPPNIYEPLPDLIQQSPRPSTANSEVDSESSEALNTNPFEFEKHASLFQPRTADIREPSIYVTEDAASSFRLGGNSHKDLAEVSDFSASDAESQANGYQNGGSRYRGASFSSSDAESQPYSRNEVSRFRGASFSDSDFMPPPPRPSVTSAPSGPSDQHYAIDHFPALPPPPSTRALSGQLTHDGMKEEILRMLGSLTGELEAVRDVYNSPQITDQTKRRDRRGAIDNGGSFSANI